MIRIICSIVVGLTVVVSVVQSALPNQCENYLLLREVKPSEKVNHPIENPYYKKVLMDALAHPNSGSKVQVQEVYNFETQSVSGYHYYVNFTGSIYNTDKGKCYVEWIQIPFVPDMPKLIQEVDCQLPKG